MFGQAHGISSAVKGLASAHPATLGIVAGIGAYYVINKYLLSEDTDDVSIEAVEADEVETAS